ncbi:uncharacterized protein LOC135226176 [Macrobrachium nipponense]|uniref:uncharacterized protein LOC135226176 n=1 Tax=Macrobrachium nipponense TaxID=159736 RepID=UPI0030C827FD
MADRHSVRNVKSITVSGVVGNAEFKNCYNGSDIVTIHDEEKTLHRLAARAQINEWQIDNEEDVAEDMITLSLATGVVCRRTALVGVDQDMKPVGHNSEIHPSEIPQGQFYAKRARRHAQPQALGSTVSSLFGSMIKAVSPHSGEFLSSSSSRVIFL